MLHKTSTQNESCVTNYSQCDMPCGSGRNITKHVLSLLPKSTKEGEKTEKQILDV